MNILETILNNSDAVLSSLEESFINDYDFWKTSINNINKGIVLFNENKDNLYTYDEFCKIFIQLIEEKLSTTSFSHELVNNILTIMMKMKYNR